MIKMQLGYELICEFLSSLYCNAAVRDDELAILCLEGASPLPELHGLIAINSNSADRYNDSLVLVWRDRQGGHASVLRATTEPGRYWTEVNPHPHGAAHLVWGHHLYKRGSHKGHKALVSASGVSRVWRDRDADFTQDVSEQIYEGRFGIHVHAGGTSESVGRWSAGCIAIHGGYESEPYRLFLERVEKHPTMLIGLTLWGGRDMARWFQDKEGWRPALRLGIRNPWVGRMQQLLNRKMDAGLVVDGDWLSATQRAFLLFQRESSLAVDGVCGPRSWENLGKA